MLCAGVITESSSSAYGAIQQRTLSSADITSELAQLGFNNDARNRQAGHHMTVSHDTTAGRNTVMSGRRVSADGLSLSSQQYTSQLSEQFDRAGRPTRHVLNRPGSDHPRNRTPEETPQQLQQDALQLQQMMQRNRRVAQLHASSRSVDHQTNHTQEAATAAPPVHRLSMSIPQQDPGSRTMHVAASMSAAEQIVNFENPSMQFMSPNLLAQLSQNMSARHRFAHPNQAPFTPPTSLPTRLVQSPLDAYIDFSSTLPPPLIPIPSPSQPGPKSLLSSPEVAPRLPSGVRPPIPARRGETVMSGTRSMSLGGVVGAHQPANDECSVCLDRAPNCVLYMCGHMCMCYDCAMDVVAHSGDCPICRQPIRDVIKIFRS